MINHTEPTVRAWPKALQNECLEVLRNMDTELSATGRHSGRIERLINAIAGMPAEGTQGEAVGRSIYERWAAQQDIHCNRLPAWQELSEQQRSEWTERATTADTGDAEVDSAIGALMSSDPTFDDCERAAAILRRLAAPPAAAVPDGMVLMTRWKIERAIEVIERDGDEHGVGEDLRSMLKLQEAAR